MSQPLPGWQLSPEQVIWQRRRMQILLEQQSVHAVRIVARDASDHVVSVPFIERQRGHIVRRSFQADRRTLPQTELLFGGTQQHGPNPMTADPVADINGDDVSAPAKCTFSDQETNDSASGFGSRGQCGCLVAVLL